MKRRVAAATHRLSRPRNAAAGGLASFAAVPDRGLSEAGGWCAARPASRTDASGGGAAPGAVAGAANSDADAQRGGREGPRACARALSRGRGPLQAASSAGSLLTRGAGMAQRSRTVRPGHHARRPTSAVIAGTRIEETTSEAMQDPERHREARSGVSRRRLRASACRRRWRGRVRRRRPPARRGGRRRPRPRRTGLPASISSRRRAVMRML